MTLIDRAWSRVSRDADGPAFVLVDDKHPLDFYVGLDVDGARILLLVCDDAEGESTQARAGFDICVARRHDKKYALQIRLNKPTLERIFSQLCSDLVESTRVGVSPVSAAASVLEQLDRWERLFERDRLRLLSEREVRGLIGELIVLRAVVLKYCTPMEAVMGWIGPLEADQDFSVRNRLIEVKTCPAGSDVVMISSERQLDDVGRPLFLGVVPLEPARRDDRGAASLPMYINAIRAELELHIEARDLFNDRLHAAGYKYRDEYASSFFVAGSPVFYEVRDDFPRISRSKIPNVISRVRYALDLRNCSAYRAARTMD